ncbi:MAG: 60S ribosomal export protein NMD3 [Thermoplasmata archaeon]|nr:60S ribosomal export protein NMD3 [Thermoplasmata archaeon]MCI4344475.1 60S ribosomal export protein NMD3 [Thermoplasmata archaeon]
MSGEFCASCGRTDVPVVDGVCAECAAKRQPLVTVPESGVLVVCPTCGARLRGRHWEGEGAPENLGSADLATFLTVAPEVGVRRIHWTETVAGETVRRFEGEADVRFRGLETKVPLHISVRTEHRVCPTCSRRTGNFYTAILQLRGPDERLRSNAGKLREYLASEWDRLVPEIRGEWRKALTRREELPEGWDLYLTDTLAARGIARHIKSRTGATLKESATLWGRRNGRDVYRVTFRVRFPVPASVGRSATSRNPPPVER